MTIKHLHWGQFKKLKNDYQIKNNGIAIISKNQMTEIE